MRRTTISHFSFLISHSIEVFKRNQVPTRPKGALNPEPRTPNPEPKTFSKKQLTQERQCGKIIPVADEAALFERAMKKISKNHLTNLYECGKIIKSLEERWFFEN